MEFMDGNIAMQEVSQSGFHVQEFIWARLLQDWLKWDNASLICSFTINHNIWYSNQPGVETTEMFVIE